MTLGFWMVIKPYYHITILPYMATTAVDFDNAWAVGLANGERGVKTRGWRASEDLRRRFRMGEHDSPLFFDRSQIMAPQNRCLIPSRFPEWINAKRDFERNEFSAALFHFHPACPFFNRVIFLSRCHSFVPIGRIHLRVLLQQDKTKALLVYANHPTTSLFVKLA